GTLPVQRHPLPNLRAVNFVVRGFLGWGVASNLLLDTQAKGLGELLRSRAVEVPASLVASGPPAARWAARRRVAAGVGNGRRPRPRPGRRDRARAGEPVERVLGSRRAPRHLGPGT